ncbi:hypothetical protein [uncultured Leifsonia sp.]|uniref:hypothetical protein n=1 Tax=uncultured Leifsonia sp. TaxID=340359 RepID=UPI0025F562B2|nr:hypothetical protein [uncultured Leifsonia sp.]
MSARTELEVLRPELFWFAAREDAPWLADPGDGRYEHARPLRWPLILPLLRTTTDALRAGAWITAEDGTTFLPPVDLGQLTVEEQWTFVMFFHDPIDVDPWDDGLSDGRHRTWGAWGADPDLILPLRSRLLADAALVDDPVYVPPARRHEYIEAYREEANEGLSQLAQSVRDRSPRYVAGLENLRALTD